MGSVERVLTVFDWCARIREEPHPESWFTEDFVFDNGAEVHDRASFIRRRDSSAGLIDVKARHTFAAGEEAAVLFECVDGATRLEVRAAWFVTFRGEQLARVTSVHNFDMAAQCEGAAVVLRLPPAAPTCDG